MVFGFPLFPCDHAAKRPTRNCLRVPSPLPLPRPALIVRCSKNGGPAGRTYTCRRWRQVRDLIIAQTEGRLLLSACHVSGSEGRRRGDSLRNLFVPQLQSDERNSKNHWFLAAFFPPFLPLLEEMGPPEASKRKAGRSLRPKVTRARGRGTLPAGGRYSSAGGGKKIVRSGKKILIFPVLSCKI